MCILIDSHSLCDTSPPTPTPTPTNDCSEWLTHDSSIKRLKMRFPSLSPFFLAVPPPLPPPHFRFHWDSCALSHPEQRVPPTLAISHLDSLRFLLLRSFVPHRRTSLCNFPFSHLLPGKGHFLPAVAESWPPRRKAAHRRKRLSSRSRYSPFLRFNMNLRRTDVANLVFVRSAAVTFSVRCVLDGE